MSTKVKDTGTSLEWDEEDVYEKVGNMLSLGPAGQYSEIESLMIIVLIDRLSKTPQGIRGLVSLAKAYLDNTGKIISSMQSASAANWMTAMINQAACSNIYVRLGLVSPRDHYRQLLWMDHIFGEMILKGYVTETVGALTTLVTSTSTSEIAGKESTAGLATLAKLLAGGK